MKDFKKGGGFKKSFGGGRPSFGGGRPSFGGGNRFGDDRRGGGDRPPQEMHQATCSDCGKACEVPFRPSGDRPVFCRDCFANHAPESSRDSRDSRDGGFKKPFHKFEDRRSDDRPRPSFAPESAPSPRIDGAQMVALTKQLELLNIKLDRLIQTVEVQRAFAEPKTAVKAVAAPVVKEKKASKAPAKKPVTKKK